MAQLHSIKGLKILGNIRDILLKNERLKTSTEKLLAQNVNLSSTVAGFKTRISALQASEFDPQESLVPLAKTPEISPSPEYDILRKLEKLTRRNKTLWTENESQRTENNVLSTRYAQLSSKPPALRPQNGVRNETPRHVPSQVGTEILVVRAPNYSAPHIPLFPTKTVPMAFQKFAKATISFKIAVIPSFNAIHLKLAKSATTSFMVLPPGFVWTDSSHKRGHYFLHTHKLTKNKNITRVNHKELTQKTMEFLALVAGECCSMGSYKVTNQTILSSATFTALSYTSQKAVILKSAKAKVARKHDVNYMFRTDQLAALQVCVERVDLNIEMCQCLIIARDALRWSGQLAGNANAAATEDARDDSDNSDDSDED